MIRSILQNVLSQGQSQRRCAQALGEWITAGQTVILTGATGCGKTLQTSGST